MPSVHLWARPGNIWQSSLSLVIPLDGNVKTKESPSFWTSSCPKPHTCVKTTHCILGRTMALLPTPSGLINMTQDPTPLICLASEFIENTWRVKGRKVSDQSQEGNDHWSVTNESRKVSDQSKSVISHQFRTKVLISLTKLCVFQGRFNRSTDNTHFRIWNLWILKWFSFTYDKYILPL